MLPRFLLFTALHDPAHSAISLAHRRFESRVRDQQVKNATIGDVHNLAGRSSHIENQQLRLWKLWVW